MLKDGAEILPTDDLGDVLLESDSGDEEQGERWTNVHIIAVPQLDSYQACLMCKARVEPCTPPLGKCSRCETKQRYDVCPKQLSARLLIMSNSKVLTVSAFGNIVRDLAQASG